MPPHTMASSGSTPTLAPAPTPSPGSSQALPSPNPSVTSSVSSSHSGNAPRKDRLKYHAGKLEVKFKGGAFSTWNDLYVKLEGKWLAMYKKEHDTTRVAAIELGPGIHLSDLTDPDLAQKFPRRFDVKCRGGLLPSTDFTFRTTSRKDRDIWAHAIVFNCLLLESDRFDPFAVIPELKRVIKKMKESLALKPVNVHSSTAVRCATGHEIVQFLVGNDLASDPNHAVAIGHHLVCMNVLHHLVWEKDFCDSMNEHFTITNFELDLAYAIEHFQKFMDTRKFWRFLEIPVSKSSSGRSQNGSSHSRMSGNSATSSMRVSNRSDTSSQLKRESSAASTSTAATTSTPQSSANGHMLQPSASTVSVSSTGSGGGDPNAPVAKKAKRCSVCEKSFNPLRRRYECGACHNTMCSHCSITRRGNDVNTGAATSLRICLTCKVSAINSNDDFYDRLFAVPSIDMDNDNDTNDNDTDRMTNDTVEDDNDSEIADQRTSSGSNLSTGKRNSANQLQSSGSMASTVSSSRSSNHLGERSASNGSIGQHGEPLPLKATPRKKSPPPSNGGHECSECGNQLCLPCTRRDTVPYGCDPVVVDDKTFYLSASAFDPEQEAERLQVVRGIRQAFTTNESLHAKFSQMCSMAAIATQCPIAIAGLLDSRDFFVCGQYGLNTQIQVTRDQSLASHTCRYGQPLMCRDLGADVRFAGNPWRKSTLLASFYAGFPIIVNHQVVGALEVYDITTRSGCQGVLEQLKTVVRSFMRIFTDLLARQAAAATSAGGAVPPRTPAKPENPPPPAPQPEPVAPPAEPVPQPAAEPAPTSTAVTQAASPAMSGDEMEAKLLQLLSQTTDTQTQLRNQQGHMVAAIQSHSKQLDSLAKQLEKMEETLNSRIGELDNSKSS